MGVVRAACTWVGVVGCNIVIAVGDSSFIEKSDMYNVISGALEDLEVTLKKFLNVRSYD